MKKQTAKILVVDNEIDICNFVKAFFAIRGFDVSTALNGDDAAALMAQQKSDVVILDVMMRKANEGFDCLKHIKDNYPDVKVIMVTGVNDDASVEKAKRLGADDYITKPLVLEYLENTVLTKIKQLNEVSG